jgi:two-component system OmpR family sensor kinase
MTLLRLNSLRARLLLLLLVAIILTAAAQAFIAYRTALAETDVILDYQMQQMAGSLRHGLPVDPSGDSPLASNTDDNIDFVLQVWTSDGLRVFRSTAIAELPQLAVLGFTNVQARGSTYRIFSMATGKQVIQVAQDLAVRRAMAGKLALRTVSPILILVPLLLLVVWWVVSASLAPVARVRQQVAARQVNDLSALSEQDLPVEIQPLVHELNLLFQRLHRAFESQQNFVADAAHEMRSPLAALKLQIRVLRRATDDAERERALTWLNAGIDRATRLVTQLLVMAQQQAHASAGVEPTPVDMVSLSNSALADVAEAAQLKRIHIAGPEASHGVVRANEDAVRILLRNLLENAIKYTPQEGTVELCVSDDPRYLALSVSDSGPGIAVADRQRVLDRFYRVSGAEGTGSGLGLAIVKTIADLHQASLTLDTSERWGGLQVTVRFRKEL